MSKPLFENAIASMETEHPEYKVKRKALSGAFLKSKMSMIIDGVKYIAMQSFAEIQSKGDTNEVDLNLYTSEVQANIIVSILVGSGHSLTKIPYVNLTTGERSEVTVSGVMNKLMEDIMMRLTTNPLAANFGESEIMKIDTYYFENCKSLRGYFTDIIENKKKAADPNAQDIVSILLQDVNYQNTDDIIDDVFTMFFAGSKTVQTTTSNLITSCLFNPDVYKRLREEVDPLMDRVKDDIMTKMNLEDVEDLEYTKMCYMESMRIAPPAQSSSTSCFNKDVSINGVNFNNGDAFYINIQYIHNDPAQWQDPTSFIPERFDTASPFYKTPAGGKRKAFSFSPFLGGSRVCLGKTFAEITLKLMLPLWFHAFDFELVNEEHKKK